MDVPISWSFVANKSTVDFNCRISSGIRGVWNKNTAKTLWLKWYSWWLYAVTLWKLHLPPFPTNWTVNSAGRTKNKPLNCFMVLGFGQRYWNIESNCVIVMSGGIIFVGVTSCGVDGMEEESASCAIIIIMLNESFCH